MCYIEGGTPFGSSRADLGSEDKSQPLDERAVFVPHQLYFSGRSRRWNGGVAYIDTAANPEIMTYGRAWLISHQQFIDLVRQENGEPDLEVDLDAAIKAEAGSGINARDRGYGHILNLGSRDGLPMLSITSPLPMADRRPAKPARIPRRHRHRPARMLRPQRRRPAQLPQPCPGVDNSLSHGQCDKPPRRPGGTRHDREKEPQHKKSGHHGKKTNNKK